MNVSWAYSEDYGQTCQVIETQTLWGDTTCRVWLPGRDSVVRTRRSRDTQLNSHATMNEIGNTWSGTAAARAVAYGLFIGKHRLGRLHCHVESTIAVRMLPSASWRDEQSSPANAGSATLFGKRTCGGGPVAAVAPSPQPSWRRRQEGASARFVSQASGGMRSVLVERNPMNRRARNG